MAILVTDEQVAVVERVWEDGRRCADCQYCRTWREFQGYYGSTPAYEDMSSCALLEGEVEGATPDMCPGYEEPNAEETGDAGADTAQDADRAAGAR